MSSELFSDQIDEKARCIIDCLEIGKGLAITKGRIDQTRPVHPSISPISGNIIREMICVISIGTSMLARISPSSSSFLTSRKCVFTFYLIRQSRWVRMGNGIMPDSWRLRLGHIALKSGDTVSFSTWTDERDHFFRRKGAAHRASLTKFISLIDMPASAGQFHGSRYCCPFLKRLLCCSSSQMDSKKPVIGHIFSGACLVFVEM